MATQNNLLSNLLQFSNFQPSSLLFCESPKQFTLQRNTNQLRNMLTAKKEQFHTPERKQTSKSLSKLELMSMSSAKIDPRERLLHRMVHKISMKCRKHYYNFFVVLENLKKNNIWLKDTGVVVGEGMKIGFAKLNQVQEILYSKHFQYPLKKASFEAIEVWSRHKLALGKVRKVIEKKSVGASFKEISLYAKKKEKEEIRMDILLDSIGHIDRAITHFHRLNYLQTFMGQLKINLKTSKERETASVKKVQMYLTPHKPVEKVMEGEFKSVKPFNDGSPFSKQKAPFLSSQHMQSYQSLKSKKRINDSSPGKIRQPIILVCEQVKLKAKKCYNFIKNSKNRTNIAQEPLACKYEQQAPFLVSKRFQPISLNCHQVPDMSDRNTIFFLQNFQPKITNTFQISESSVQHFPRSDAIDQVPPYLQKSLSQEIHSNSQITLIAPLTDNFNEQSRKSVTSSTVKGSAFGSEAVSFKNSLVIQRELMKNQVVEERSNKDRKEFNFAKIKNQVKSEKKAHDEYIRESQSRFRYDYRYDSADKDYSSLKFRRESQFTITIPQINVQSANTTGRNPNFPKRNSDTPQPEILRTTYASQRKHLSLMNNNKMFTMHEDNKKGTGATYLKILSKK